MELPEILEPKTPLNKAYRKQKISRPVIEQFKTNLQALLSELDEEESEEHVKNDVIRFLDNTWYKDEFAVNTKGRTDLVIHNEKSTKSSAGVLVEVKRPGNKSHMVSKNNLNTMALQELLLYYLRERVEGENKDIKHLVVTNVYEWFVFDAAAFYTHFFKNTELIKGFKAWSAGRKDSTSTQLFYKEIAAPAIEQAQESLTFTWFDLRDYKKHLVRKEDSNKLINLYKILSPVHLLKLPFANDSNSLNRQFYNELLHIIGLEEVKEKGKKVIQRKAKGKRNESSLLENAMAIMDERDRLRGLEKPSQYGKNQEEQLYTLGLELCITWVNRILFLKLLESQLVAYHNEDKHFNFLNITKVPDYDALEGLFFGVLARKPADRSERYRERYANVPYLNSSLFEPTDLENVLAISMLNHSIALEVHTQTVLKDAKGKRYKGKKDALTYLFEFLDAYDFSSEGKEKIQEESKSLINASVLGLIFEKINGYKDGSFYTPGFITMYMCRETIRKAVVQKFNDAKRWELTSFDQLYDRIDDKKEANGIINSLKICDPAVGSGHFLVSALNEIIAIKSELKILQDREGKTLRDYEVVIENDELTITDDNSELFEYTVGSKERQRVQEIFFNEKQTIIENCLFGVDINPNSVKICRLRLWIELLKSAYYKQGDRTKNSSPVCYADGDEVRPEYKIEEAELETLPNIDINIKCGNSLISRFDLDSDISAALKKSKWDITTYRNAVDSYKNATKKDDKREFERLIDSIKGDFETEVQKTDKRYVRANKLKGELFNLTDAPKLFEQTKAEKKKWKTDVEKKTKALRKLETELDDIKNSKIYENAFEWRFEFPEVLDDEGNFMGFDVVIGNPPYIRQELLGEFKEYFQASFRVFEGTADLFSYFYEKACSILKEGGCFAYISNTFEKTRAANKLRAFVTKKTLIDNYVDFTEVQVFEGATTYPVIILAIKSESEKTAFNYTKIPRNLQGKAIDIDLQKFIRIPQKLLDPLGWNFYNQDKFDLLNKINKNKSIREKYDKSFRGIVTGFNQAFIIDEGRRKELIDSHPGAEKIIKPFLEGKDLGKWESIKKDKFIIFTRRGTNIDEYPSVKDHLLSYKKELTPRNSKDIKVGRKPGPYKWFEIQDSVDYFKIFEAPKITWPNLQSSNKFSIDYGGHYINAPSVVFPNASLALLGILNSKLIWKYLLSICVVRSGGYIEVKPQYFEKIPIPNIDEKDEVKIEEKVNQILALKKENPEADTSALEQEIDQLVYQLYELTEEEIAIVEGTTLK